jgi:hypothetical protein
VIDPLPLLQAEARRRGLVHAPWLADMHPAQRSTIEDSGKSKAMLCGRRSGKTFCACAGLVTAVDRKPKTIALYLSLTGKQARWNLWPQLLSFNSRYGLGLTPHANTMTCEHPNGGTIEIGGADAENAIERLRGRPYSRVIIDEAASFSGDRLKYVCEEAVGPALKDYEGDIWLIGSPGAVLAGYFYERTAGEKRWPVYSATMRDNPFFDGRAERLLADERAERGWTVNSPAYLREYEGKWVRDTTSLVFDYDASRNSAANAPAGVQHVIAVDLGTSAKRETTAFAVLGYQPGAGVWAVHAKRHGLLCPSDVGSELDRLVRIYDPNAIVMDQGGLGAGYIEEIRRRFRLPVKPVQKRDKMGYVDLLNGDLRKGVLRIVADQCKDLVEEITILQWHESREQYDDRFADHCSDAMLYAWRECRAYLDADMPAALPGPGMDRRQAEMEAFEDEEDDDNVSAFKRIIGTR